VDRTYSLVDTELARRIEAATTRDFAAFVTSASELGIYPHAEVFRVAGGAAVWLSEGNVVNGSVGLGMDRPVEQEEVAALIAFFEERGASPDVDVCPYADESLRRWIAEYRFVTTDFETVLYQPLPAPALPAPAPGVQVRIADSAEERELWGRLEALGFSESQPTDADLALSRSLALRGDALPFLGYLDGEPAGTGMLVVSDGVAMFNGDSTLPDKRNRGVQSAILAARLAHASEAGCDLALIEATPGGASQRNQERLGFRVAYTRASMKRIPAA
jgi:GNAT superfamily N-acetyltransferase